MGQYAEAHRRSIEAPEEFWAEAAADVVWQKPWDRVLDNDNPPFTRWFVGGKINTCFNALDRHVADGRGDQAAVIYDSPVTGTIETISYASMRDRVAAFAGVLRKYGVGYGDRVIVYMPMIPEALVAMLACARIGAIHSTVFGGFAANELAKRIADATPKLVVSASCGIEPGRIVEYKPLLDGALEISDHKPETCIVVQRPQATARLVAGRDVEWHDAHAGASPADCVEVAAIDPLYILYTSGTTGVPKGVVRPNAGHLVALKWSMRNIYDVEPGQVFWAASDIGWVVGHSYIVYAPLLHGCATVLYEGKPVGTPDAGAFWRVIAQHRVSCMFTAPTAMRAIRKEDPDARLLRQYDISHYRTQFLAGERCDPDTLRWTEEVLKVPVIDHWWQTESGWPMAANCLGIETLPVKPGSPTVPVPGWNIEVLDPAGKPVEPGEIGAISVRLPMPPSALSTLWRNDRRFEDSYMVDYPGYYQTGDAGMLDSDGYLFVMSRTDDIINVAGHRLSTGGMEEVLASHPDVAECAVIGAADSLKGQVPLGFLVLKDGIATDHATVVADVVRMVRTEIGPVASFRQAVVVPRLPKTRSGKILRGTMQSIADNREFASPATIEDAAVLPEITAALKTIGYAGGQQAT